VIQYFSDYTPFKVIIKIWSLLAHEEREEEEVNETDVNIKDIMDLVMSQENALRAKAVCYPPG